MRRLFLLSLTMMMCMAGAVHIKTLQERLRRQSERLEELQAKMGPKEGKGENHSSGRGRDPFSRRSSLSGYGIRSAFYYDPNYYDVPPQEVKLDDLELQKEKESKQKSSPSLFKMNAVWYGRTMLLMPPFFGRIEAPPKPVARETENREWSGVDLLWR